MTKLGFKELSGKQYYAQSYIKDHPVSFLTKIQELIEKLNKINGWKIEISNPEVWYVDTFKFAFDYEVFECKTYLLNVHGTLNHITGSIHFHSKWDTSSIKETLKIDSNHANELIINILDDKPKSTIGLFQLNKYLLLTVVIPKETT